MSFERPSLSDLISRAAADFETRLPAADPRLRRSNLSVLGMVHSAAVHGLYGFLSWLARQVMVDTAETEWLERHGGIWGISRKAATAATATATFTGTDGSTIPAGTVVQRADGVRYLTDAPGTISAGVAAVAVTAETSGAEGDAPGLVKVSLISPLTGIDATATLDASGAVGGADAESDTRYRDRVLARIQQPPHGGADFDYHAWALEVAAVTRAWVSPLELGAGTVVVRFVTDDADGGPIPDTAKVAEVQAYLDARRPVTAAVTVAAPIDAPLDFTITGLDPSTQAVRDAVEAELAATIQRDATPGGTLLISHLREAISVAAGEHDHALTTPSADVPHSTGQLASLGTITWA